MFGDKLRELREQNNLTQVELSKKLQIEQSTLANYESGRRVPKLELVIAVSKLFNVSTDYLLGTEKEDKGYYVNEETAQYAEELRTNSELKVLFSASKSLSKADMKKAYEYIKFLKSQEHSKDDFIE